MQLLFLSILPELSLNIFVLFLTLTKSIILNKKCLVQNRETHDLNSWEAIGIEMGNIFQPRMANKVMIYERGCGREEIVLSLYCVLSVFIFGLIVLRFYFSPFS